MLSQLTIQVGWLPPWHGEASALAWAPGLGGLGRGRASFLSLSGQALLTQHWPHYPSSAPATAAPHTNRALS